MGAPEKEEEDGEGKEEKASELAAALGRFRGGHRRFVKEQRR